MMENPNQPRIRVGFIGLNPDSHWAATAHVPALDALGDKFTIVGVANSTPESSRRDTGKTIPKTAPDQIMVHGVLTSGKAVSIHYRGGVSHGTNLLWEINGTEGDIQVTGALGHAQMIQLTVRGARGEEAELAPLMPSASSYVGWPDFAGARNIAQVYARMYDDILNGTRTAPSF